MIARSFRPVGWVAGVGAAALCCYMLSLRVAAERADLDRLDSRIVAAAQEIRSLQTELGTRGRMQQLEAWNDDVLALSAPTSGQFVEHGVSLARFDARQPPIAPAAEVRLASAPVRPATQQAPASAAPTPQRAVAAPAPAAPPIVRRTSLTATAAATETRRTQPVRALASEETRRPAATPTRTVSTERNRPAPTPTRSVAAERPRPATAAASNARRPAGLLDDRTIRDLRTTSRAERGGGTGN